MVSDQPSRPSPSESSPLASLPPGMSGSLSPGSDKLEVSVSDCDAGDGVEGEGMRASSIRVTWPGRGAVLDAWRKEREGVGLFNQRLGMRE